MKQNNTIAHTKTNKNNNLKINLIPVTMKTKMNFLKTAVMAIALMGAAQVSAQTYPTAPVGTINAPGNLNTGTVTYDGTNKTFAAVTNTLSFYRPTSEDPAGSVVNLEATLKDANGFDFDDHIWYIVEYSGSPATENEVQITTGLSGTTNEFLSVENLEPGYNRIRVRGEVGSTITCPSVEYQDIIVFVLPQLDVVPSVNGTETEYCVGDEPAAGEVTLSASIDADYTGNDNTYPKPGDSNDADTAFNLSYNWYAVSNSTPPVTTSLGTTATVDLSTASLAPGTYTFFVDVEYDSNIRNKGTKSYVTYGGSATATTQTVIVNPIPTTPNISVVGIDD